MDKLVVYGIEEEMSGVEILWPTKGLVVLA